MTHSDNPTDAFEPRSAITWTLVERGYVNQVTDLAGVDGAFAAGVVPVYAGFDATADSLHVGHLMPIMALRRLQQAGHKPIVLIGGGTTRIGDPSFRSAARPMLSEDEIAANVAGIRKVFERLLTFGDGPSDAVMVNNADWLDRMAWIDMLRDVGKHFSVNRMLSFDSVKTRLEQQENLSFLEFNYMILQAVDFLELFRRTGCRLQLGGGDQWGNIVGGVDLLRRIEGAEVFGMTTPLLTTASGVKMGKTAAGAVWVNEDRLSPYDYWQFWRNAEDADVVRFLKLFTELPIDEIERLGRAEGAELNAVKERLANEATALVHGRQAADHAQQTARQAFGQGEAAAGLPTVELDDAERTAGVMLIDLLVRAGLAASKSEARRAISGRGVRIDGEVVEDGDGLLTVAGRPLRLSLGKKRHVVVK
ncbi:MULTISPECIES: tyrosine--tRNA ligase [Ensifer]|uniref:Tyrosine--tRNA ligase n=1 Tax=Ensifer adhaerens TaxID=106592 RepID=A0ABY8HJX9_ENSAD|nr:MULTISPECIES: tyrosine--tRNA ligase [Ensifer]ANK72642.1 tyrosine--tRNA ligase [Ensifer adhaerens]KDP76418.1 tyrosyl-tRNA synthetase [Ensifer adhaerens]KQX32979.1 tyrosine--tRNA ligase [Ensifer sp. Root423]KQZ58544.1 tyrosine--tRNA ligase [Ensifer sp. Root558]MBD9495295.1 tyrosine--tRNA ligase [Ensifer sp. ENS01]